MMEVFMAKSRSKKDHIYMKPPRGGFRSDL